MEIEVVERWFGNPCLEMLYTEMAGGVPLAIVNADLSEACKEARRLEALGYARRRAATGLRRKFCYSARSFEDLDPKCVESLCYALAREKTDWPRRISMATQETGSYNPYLLRAWCSLPFSVVMACLLLMWDPRAAPPPGIRA